MLIVFVGLIAVFGYLIGWVVVGVFSVCFGVDCLRWLFDLLFTRAFALIAVFSWLVLRWRVGLGDLTLAVCFGFCCLGLWCFDFV